MAFGDTEFILEEPKPPPYILWIIGVTTCLLFAASVVLLTIGAIYAYGVMGMALVGCGAVLYLATVVGLFVACIKVQKKYPGRRLLPSRLMPGRTVRRLSLLTNPNTSGSAPGKEPNGQIPQDQSTAPEMQNDQAQEEIPPVALNSEESPAMQVIHMVMRDLSQEELVLRDQSNPNQEDISSLNACSEEVTIVADSETFSNGSFQLNNKENVLTPQTDSQLDCNNTEPKASIPSQAQSTSDQMDQHDQELLGRIQCTAEDSSPCPSDPLSENELVLNNQDQQHETTITQITESKAQGQTSFPINGKPELYHEQDDSPQDTPGTASDSKGSNTMLVCAPFTDCATEAYQKQHQILTAMPPIALGSQDGASVSSASAPSNPELELMHKLYQDNDDTMATKPNLGEGTITPLKFSPKAMQQTSFHKQHPYLEESHCTDPNFGEFTTTLPDTTPSKSKHISFQNQKQCHEDSHLQAPCSNISNMLSASPANPRINGSPHSGDYHVPNVPSTPSEPAASDEIHISQNLPPKDCDDVRTSPSNCQDVPTTASPFLLSHRRQMSFHTQIEHGKFVLPTGLYAGNANSEQGAFVPSHRKYLSDLEECHLHQEERLRPLRFRDPSWTPDTSSPSYRKLRSHRGQHLFFKDMPHAPAAHFTEPETAHAGLDPISRILVVHTRHPEPNPYESTVDPCYPDSILTCWEYSPWSENTAGSHPNHNPYYMDESSSLSSCSTEHETTVADPNLLTDSARSASTLGSHVNQDPYYQDLPPTPSSNTTKHDIVKPGLDPSSGILAVRSRLSESNPHEITVDPRYADFIPTRLKDLPGSAREVSSHLSQHPYYKNLPSSPASCLIDKATAQSGHNLSSTVDPCYSDMIHTRLKDLPGSASPVKVRSPPSQGPYHKSLPPSPGSPYKKRNTAHDSFDQNSRIRITHPKNYDYDPHEIIEDRYLSEPIPNRLTALPRSSNTMRSHLSQHVCNKDIPPSPATCLKPYTNAHAVFDSSRRVISAPPSNYRSNPHGYAVEPRYPDHLPSRLVALPRSASHPREYPRNLDAAVRIPPSRHFSSSAVASTPSLGRSRSHLRRHQQFRNHLL